MRKLAWAALPFAAAIFLAQYLLPAKGLPYLSAALLLVSPLAFLCRGKTRWLLLSVCLAAAVGFGWCWLFDAWRTGPCEELAGKDLFIQAHVTEYPQVYDSYSRVEVRLDGDGLPRENMALYLYDGELPPLRPGDRIAAEVRVAAEPLRQADKSIFLRGYIQRDSLMLLGRWQYAWLYFPREIARTLSQTCDAVFPPAAAGLVKALMLGDREALFADTKTYSDLRMAGVAHAVAVSGMHLGFLVTMVQLLLGKGRRGSLVCILLIVLFALITGASPSVLRAAAVFSLHLLAPLFDRESDGITSLSAALAALLLINPRAAGSISLQLSFAAAAGLLLLTPPLIRWRDRHIRHRVLRFAVSSFICTLGASVFTVPLVACHFGNVALMAPLSNLLTIPLLEFVFISGYGITLLGLLWPAAASLLAWVPAAVLWLCRLVYGIIADLPFACVYTDNGTVIAWLVFVYGIFGLFLLRRRKGRAFRPVMPCALSVIGLCLVLLSGQFLSTRRVSVTALDVGQGASTALVCRDAVLLVDCGGSGPENAGDTAANFLRSQGQGDVDLLVLTHLHADHVNGVAQLMNRIPVQQLLLSADVSDDDELLPAILQAAEEAGTEIIYITAYTEISLGGMELCLCQPLLGSDENERGIALRAELGGKSVLITGDLDTEAELYLSVHGFADDTDILMAGHHGSGSSSSHYLLQAARPEQAIISVGQNSYGHPTREALERLYAYCGQVRRTDVDGNITIRIE